MGAKNVERKENKKTEGKTSVFLNIYRITT